MLIMYNKNKYEKRCSIFKALSHPLRLFIVDLLREKERCVCEITDNTELHISTISKHLTILKNSGIISFRKENNKVFYKLVYNCISDINLCLEKKEERI